MFREPTLIADTLALGHSRLDVDQFPDGILLELRLGFALGVCLQCGKHCRLIELVPEMFRPDELRSASRQIAELPTTFLAGNSVVEVDDYIAEFVVEGNNERAFISMNTQNIVRLEVDDGNGIQVIDIDSGKPFAIVLPLNVGNICFYDTNGNVVEYLRQQL